MTTPVILDEDTYTEAISFIIQRDFFPQLAKLKAESSYHEAQINGDIEQLQQARQLLSQLNNPKPNQDETAHVQNYYHPEETDLGRRINLELALDQFQTVYTSEDNASFTELLEKANSKRKSHYRWFYDKNAQQLLIEDDKTTQKRISSQSGGGNLLMYYPEGPSRSFIDESNQRGAPKAIAYNNTSLDNSSSQPSSIKSTSTTIADQHNNIGDSTWEDLCHGQSTPSFRGYNLVESTPTIRPSNMNSPLMTWGSIEGTPIQIAGSETPGPRFSLPRESTRDKLGMKLSEKASRAYRKRTNERNRNVKGTPRTGSGLMSPAAQHLLRRSNTPYTKGIDMALRSSYGGSPSRLSTNSPRFGKTPTPLFRAGASSKMSPFQPQTKSS